MIPVFQQLGNQVNDIWNKYGRSPESFPEIATTAMSDSGVLQSIEPAEIVEWLGSSAELPEQYAKEFGQPPINVYVAPDFYIQVLYWIDGTTAIHEHSFKGAFGVLSGSSVHSRYDFEVSHRASAELHVGNINFVSSEFLKRGDIHAIDTGENLIHALFHLDRPSISLVVRTRCIHERQFSYLKPHIGYDAYHDDNISKTRLRMLESLRSLGSEMFWKYAHLLADQASPWMLLHVLSITHQQSAEDPAGWKNHLEHVEQRHGSELIDRMVLSIQQESRIKKLTRFRAVIHDPDQRFFLALLLNVPRRDTLLSMISARFNTSNPKTLVLNWIRDMSERGLFRSKADPVFLDIIKLAMQYESFDEAKSSWSQENSSPVDPDKMRRLWEAAHASDFLQPLFR